MEPADKPRVLARAAPAAMRLTATAAEVAALLSCAESTFREKRQRLERDHGFPPRLPGCNGWSLPAVRRWIATNGATYLPSDHPREYASIEIATDLSPAARRLLDEYGRNTA